MLFIPYKKGSKKLSILNICLFLLIFIACIVTPSEIGNRETVYLMALGQMFLSLGVYCLLPSALDESLDIGGIGFAILPLIIDVVSAVILGLLSGIPFSSIIEGHNSIGAYWISYTAGTLSIFGLYYLTIRRSSLQKHHNEKGPVLDEKTRAQFDKLLENDQD